MSDLLDDLKNQWKDARNENPEHPSTKKVIQLSKKKMNRVAKLQIGNIAVLTATFIVIFVFFAYVAPLQEILSRIGIFLMLGGLLLRILIECNSIYRSSKIDISDAAATANEKSLRYYAYRKRIHGPVTVGILVAYTIGFYILTPEFSDYFTTTQVVMMDASYLVAALIFGYSIRKAIKSEMMLLDELRQLQNELIDK